MTDAELSAMRCLVTGNPQDTDTRPAGRPCLCAVCTLVREARRLRRCAAATEGGRAVTDAQLDRLAEQAERNTARRPDGSVMGYGECGVMADVLAELVAEARRGRA